MKPSVSRSPHNRLRQSSPRFIKAENEDLLRKQNRRRRTLSGRDLELVSNLVRSRVTWYNVCAVMSETSPPPILTLFLEWWLGAATIVEPQANGDCCTEENMPAPSRLHVVRRGWRKRQSRGGHFLIHPFLY